MPDSRPVGRSETPPLVIHQGGTINPAGAPNLHDADPAVRPSPVVMAKWAPLEAYRG